MSPGFNLGFRNKEVTGDLPEPSENRLGRQLGVDGKWEGTASEYGSSVGVSFKKPGHAEEDTHSSSWVRG